MGTSVYMSPEFHNIASLCTTKEWCIKYNKGIDVWAMGITLYFMLFKSVPYSSHAELLLTTPEAHNRYMLQHHVGNKMLTGIMRTVRVMLAFDYRTRVSAENALMYLTDYLKSLPATEGIKVVQHKQVREQGGT